MMRAFASCCQLTPGCRMLCQRAARSAFDACRHFHSTITSRYFHFSTLRRLHFSPMITLAKRHADGLFSLLFSGYFDFHDAARLSPPLITPPFTLR